MCQLSRKPCGVDVRLATNPIVGLIVLLCAVRIRDLVVLVVFVDEVQQNRAALEQPDSLAAGLVRDGRDLRALLAKSPAACTTMILLTHPAIRIDLKEPVFLFR